MVFKIFHQFGHKNITSFQPQKYFTILLSKSVHHCLPVLVVGEVVLQQGVGKETIKVGILTSYKLVLLQSILQSWGTFQLFKLVIGIVEDGGVGMGKGVDVRFPDGGWGIPLYQEVDCEDNIGHGL